VLLSGSRRHRTGQYKVRTQTRPISFDLFLDLGIPSELSLFVQELDKSVICDRLSLTANGDELGGENESEYHRKYQ
jgi:hypothetical protein